MPHFPLHLVSQAEIPQAEIVKIRPDPAGWMKQRDGTKKLIPLTDENNHLAFYNTSNSQTEIVYQHSAIIVDCLELFLSNKNQLDKLPQQGKLAFFDTDGQFYNFAVLESLNPEQHKNGLTKVKHNAVFSMPSMEKVIIAVDDIYCVSLVQRPLLGWQGDDS